MRVKHLILDVVTAGRGKHADIEVLRKILTLNALMFPGLFFSLILGITALSDGNWILALADGVFFLTQIWVLTLTRRAANLEVPVKIAVNLLFAFFLALALIGGKDGTAIVWTLLYPSVAVYLSGTKRGFFLSLAFLAALVGVFLAGNSVPFILADYPSSLEIRIVAVYITITLLSLIAEELRSRIHRNMRESSLEKEKAIEELHRSMKEIKTLRGILPICLHCKKIRDDDGYWQAVDQYIHSRTEAEFSHALCPDCLKKHYPEYSDKEPTE
ncbi:MAG TPA: hypothetical protein P5207_09340 [Candidatus Sabulitectum sp.]|nr:hypothetical protein [Candidatus Sabulitectum sp.]